MVKLFSGIFIWLAATVLPALADGVPRGIDWSSNPGDYNVISKGKTFESTGATFTFELGASTVTLAPDLSNVRDWLEAWQSLGSTIYSNTNNAFSSSSSLGGKSVFAAGEQAFIWGYNQRTFSSSTQWILVANPVWTWPGVDADPHPNLIWSLGTAPPSAARIGALNPPSGAFHMRTAVVNPPPPVTLPEPGALLALGGLLLVGLRRVRG